MLQYPMFPYYVPLLQCLQTLCSSVSHKSPTPLAWREAVPQKRENQINTLVLKDINFTINIIELSYYRTIDTLNQSKMLPWHVYLEAEPVIRNVFLYHSA